MESGLFVVRNDDDVNGAVTIRGEIPQRPLTGNMCDGWLAQIGVFVFDGDSGTFKTGKQRDCKR